MRGMAADGIPYTGFLYAGLMIGGTAGQDVEFNCRMGDPETQPIMMRLKSDLLELLEHAVAGKLDQIEVPETPRKGRRHQRPAEGETDDSQGLHAGAEGRTARSSLPAAASSASPRSATTSQAQKHAYDASSASTSTACSTRRDIGHRAVTRKDSKACWILLDRGNRPPARFDLFSFRHARLSRALGPYFRRTAIAHREPGSSRRSKASTADVSAATPGWKAPGQALASSGRTCIIRRRSASSNAAASPSRTSAAPSPPRPPPSARTRRLRFPGDGRLARPAPEKPRTARPRT